MQLNSESLALPETSPLKKSGSPQLNGEPEKNAGGEPAAPEALHSLLTQLHGKIELLMASLPQESKSAERMVIKSAGRILFLRFTDIDWIEAADNYVNLHVGQESHSLRETMNALEARLSSKRFVRISRSAMVNVEHIKELQPMLHGEYVAVLRNGMRLTVTRGYREKMRELSLM
jgi:two-component system LytT family response regulator